MGYLYYLSVICILLLASCAKVRQIQEPAYQFTPPLRQLDYLSDVKPILEKRCVVCHSCYNSPCQLKLSSWEGLERGASKEAIYNGGRLRTMEPSRLFMDGHSEQEWRDKGFFSVTRAPEGELHESTMFMLLDHKRLSPKVSGNYYPESADLTCSSDSKELKKYLKKHPNNGMPFGFPPLKNEEFNTVAGWLLQGAKGPTREQQEVLKAIPSEDQELIKLWEDFLNDPDSKYRMTARYLYEHLFLAHITFKTGTNNFYELVRSRTAPGKPVDIIATVRPYDDPGREQFYYRFRKIHATIVHKTHMVFAMDRNHFARVQELFIEPVWDTIPYDVGYESKLSANPFQAFSQIPAKSRYLWLLDNSHYVIMTFIRGPVCKGQIALNVVNDHFWLLFLDPEYDLSIKYPGFLKVYEEKLRLPGEKGSDYRLFKALLSNKHYKWAIDYYKERALFYGIHYPKGLTPGMIWKGNRPGDAPMLTVYRHFDSASVHRGALGNLPRTGWVIDYPLLERIYYSLVAGFDIYGTAGHQLATRLYMDALRIEGESYFLDFMPPDIRREKMASWYKGVEEDKVHYYPSPMPAGHVFMTQDPQREFLELVVNSQLEVDGIGFDLNYLRAGEEYPELPNAYTTREDLIRGFIATTAPGVSFFRHVANHNANVAWIRIKNMPNREDIVVSAVVNRWHDNVKFVFQEDLFLDPTRDRVNFIPGFIGSYPNYFFEVDYSEIPDFLEILGIFDGSFEHRKWLDLYGVNRARENFWEVYDWFQYTFQKNNPETGGLFDLNRYYFRANAE